VTERERQGRLRHVRSTAFCRSKPEMRPPLRKILGGGTGLSGLSRKESARKMGSERGAYIGTNWKKKG